MGYGGDNWVWEYEETDEIKRVFEDSGRLLIRCVNDGFYHEAVELFDIMMETEVTVENDWDPFTMGLEKLLDEGLISVNLENLALHVLYAAYQKAAPEERARVLYDYFTEIQHNGYWRRLLFTSMEKMDSWRQRAGLVKTIRHSI